MNNQIAGYTIGVDYRKRVGNQYFTKTVYKKDLAKHEGLLYASEKKLQKEVIDKMNKEA